MCGVPRGSLIGCLPALWIGAYSSQPPLSVMSWATRTASYSFTFVGDTWSISSLYILQNHLIGSPLPSRRSLRVRSQQIHHLLAANRLYILHSIHLTTLALSMSKLLSCCSLHTLYVRITIDPAFRLNHNSTFTYTHAVRYHLSISGAMR